MDYPEIEIMPGVYVTDYRKKPTDTVSTQRSNLEKPNAQEYRRELLEKGMIDPELLNAERHRFEAAISKLEESNAELAEDTDPEFLAAIEENQGIIEKYKEFIGVLDELLGESGSLYL